MSSAKHALFCRKKILSSRMAKENFVAGAGNEARTRYLHLGKVALYQMSYDRIVVVRN